MKLDWKAVLGLIISVGLLWWLFKDQDPGAIWAQIREADPWLFIAAVAVATSAYAIRAVRWNVLLQPVAPDTSFRNRWATIMIGFGANNILPARIGEFVRAYALGKVEKAPFSGTFGTLVVARFLDAVAVIVLLLFALAVPSFPAEAEVLGRPVAQFARTSALFVGGVLLAVAVVVARPRLIVRLAERFSGLLPGQAGPRVVGALRSFLDGLSVLRTPSLLGRALGWSLLHWAYYGLSFWLALEAFGIDVGYAGALFTQAMVAVGVSIPSAPGFFGTWHAAAQIALVGPYGVEEARALAFATGYHLGGFVPITVLGFYYAWRLKISIGEARSPGAPSDDGVTVGVDSVRG